VISKICSGHSFRGAIQYVCREDKHAQILSVEGVRDHSVKLMIRDFERQHSLRPEKKQACFHGILSFYPGENPDDQKIREIAGKYLEGLDIRNTQTAIMKHSDKEHLHVHLIVNMVNNQGQSISDKWIGLRGKKLSQKLTQEYKLTQSLSKDLSRIHYQSLKEPEQYKYKIYAAIKNQLRQSRSIEELKLNLERLGIETLYKFKGQTTEIQGISFKLGEYKFKGSEIDRNFSYLKLEKSISLHQEQNLIPKMYQTLRDRLPSNSQSQKVHHPGLSQSATNIIQKTLELLFKEEQQRDQMPYELTQNAERKKRQRMRQQNHER
jgi:Relaxase/Mobilisation nuclease domain